MELSHLVIGVDVKVRLSVAVLSSAKFAIVEFRVSRRKQTFRGRQLKDHDRAARTPSTDHRPIGRGVPRDDLYVQVLLVAGIAGCGGRGSHYRTIALFVCAHGVPCVVHGQLLQAIVRGMGHAAGGHFVAVARGRFGCAHLAH